MSAIRPIVRRPVDSVPEASLKQGRDALVWAYNLAFVGVCVMAGLVTLLASYHVYLQNFESRTPSGHVFIESDGARVYLVQPTAVVSPRAASASAEQAQPVTDDATTPVTETPSSGVAVNDPTPSWPPTTSAKARNLAPTPRADVPLPPVGLVAPAIGVDVPVRITTSDSLPRQPYAGWYFRSAFPATAGNVVLLGHVDGEAAIFARLGDLKPGDEVRVLTTTQTHIYVVEWVAFVDGSAVEVLGPIDQPVLTLITCAGTWDPDTRTYESRLVVRAEYAAVEERVASR
ncbi:MAG TPA: class F sortase [Thermomicrobiales bacterium]|nr:class F sortase [Thermomicrobiales bacterium]